jgi:hypothetical protein
MSDSKPAEKIQHTATSAHIALGAGLISSTLFLVAASLVAVGCLIATTQGLGELKEGSDDNMRAMVWGGLSFFNVVVFYICGIVGLRKVMRGYKETERIAKGG